jgi:protein ImuA
MNAELPGNGWPSGVLVKFLVQQPGIGEMRLLRPAVAETGKPPIVLLQPPHVPNAQALSYPGLPLNQVIRLRAQDCGRAVVC